MASLADIADNAPKLIAEYCDPASRYAWPSYDIDLSPGRLQPTDGVAPALLSYPINGKLLQRLFAADGSEYSKLWDLMCAVVSHPEANSLRFEAVPSSTLDSDSSDGVWASLVKAWTQVDRCKGLTMVGVTKILHRKLPNLIPIRDSLVMEFYGAQKTSEMFSAIHADLHAVAPLLDEWRAPYTVAGREMTRLRVIDIAIWMHQKSRGLKSDPGPEAIDPDSTPGDTE